MMSAWLLYSRDPENAPLVTVTGGHSKQKKHNNISPGGTVKPVLSDHVKRRQKRGIQQGLSLNVGQKYCRMFQGEHSAIISAFIKLPFVIKIFLLCLFLSGCLRQVLL